MSDKFEATSGHQCKIEGDRNPAFSVSNPGFRADPAGGAATIGAGFRHHCWGQHPDADEGAEKTRNRRVRRRQAE